MIVGDAMSTKYEDLIDANLEVIKTIKLNWEFHSFPHFLGSVTLSLAEGIMHDVFISSVVNGGRIYALY